MGKKRGPGLKPLIWELIRGAKGPRFLPKTTTPTFSAASKAPRLIPNDHNHSVALIEPAFVVILFGLILVVFFVNGVPGEVVIGFIVDAGFGEVESFGGWFYGADGG